MRYTYEITVLPPVKDFNSRNLRPTVAKVIVRNAFCKAHAIEMFREVHFPTLRRNGIVRGVKQALACMTVRRMTCHKENV